jgi:hypothetical protein
LWNPGADRIAILKGTVNDATSFPEANKAHGSYHWAFERLLSAALIPAMGAAAVSSGSTYVSAHIPSVDWVGLDYVLIL